MKTIMILVICLLLVLSLAACGGQDVSADTAAPATESQPVEQTPAPTTEAPTEETVPETQPAFDNSWAANDYEKLIPQPPFEDWTGSVMAPNVYVLSCAYGNEEDWGIYKQTLLDAGFSLEDVDRGYKGFDAMGNYFEFMCTENQAMIVIESVEALGE